MIYILELDDYFYLKHKNKMKCTNKNYLEH